MTGGGGEGPAELRIEPVVSRPRTAHAGRSYLVTVDLRGAGAEGAWPYAEEEFAFGITLDGQPRLVCEALGHPGVVLHRFGDTYGPARFLVTAGPDPGPAELRLTVSNGWGVPVRTARLGIDVLPAEPDQQGAAPPVEIAGALPARSGGYAAPEPDPEPEPEPEPGDRLTISFAGHNRAWASWIAGVLERHGVQAVPQRWDVAAGAAIADGLRDLLLSRDRVLLVLSDWYFRLGARPQAEWEAALDEVVAPRPDRFRAVAVTPDVLPAATALLVPARLWDVDAEQAETLLLARLGIPPARDPGTPAERPATRRFPPETPAVWGGIPRRNSRFTGREEVIARLAEEFQQAGPGAGVVTLLGLSGVGKTHIATEYVHRFQTEYDVVWWVRAAERGMLREKLAGLAPALGLRTGREYGERLRAVRDALRRGEPYGRWLVVLDGADRPEDVHDLVPVGPGHVLITSQNREWDEHNSSLVEVPLYTRPESVAFVRRRAPRLGEPEADRLADALGDLALALDQNAGALNDSNTPVDEYIELLRRGADVEPGLKVAADFQMTYYTAFAILLNRLREDMPEAVDLLRLCVFFAPGPIPVRLLGDARTRDVPARLHGLLRDPLVRSAAIGKLAQWSVIQTEPQDAAGDDPAAGGDAIQMHRLVHQAVRLGMSDAEQDLYSEVVRGVLAAADPGRPDDTASWPAYAGIVPHLDASGALHSRDPGVRAMVLDCLRYLYLAGEHAAGLHLARRALTAWQADGDGAPDGPGIWDLVHHHGNLLRATGDYAATEAADRDAWQRLRTARGPDHPDTLRAAAGLAADLRGLARYREAAEVSAAVAEAGRRAYGERDPRTLVADNNHAVSLRLLGHYEEALALDRAVLAARLALLGPEHRWTLLSEVGCAEDLRLLGRAGQALERQRDTYTRHRAVLGPDAAWTIRAGQVLALCLADCGDPGAAGEILALLLERGERVLGDAHPFTVVGRSLYACHQRVHGDLETARELGEEALARYRTGLGEAHPFTAGALGNHALLLHAAGERTAARGTADRALAAMTAAVGAGHPWELGCAANAAALAPPDPAAGAALSDRAAARLGAGHPLVLTCREGGTWDFQPLTT